MSPEGGFAIEQVHMLSDVFRSIELGDLPCWVTCVPCVPQLMELAGLSVAAAAAEAFPLAESLPPKKVCTTQ